jgi:hypothetical protein
MTSDKNDDPAPTPGCSPRTASPGYQTGSTEPPSSAEVPGSGSSGEDDDLIDPIQAFAEVAAKERERKKREREPGLWLPGADDMDRENGLPDAETRFSRDAYGGRGNPQLSVRLRPRAILDAELRRDGEFLRDRSGG